MPGILDKQSIDLVQERPHDSTSGSLEDIRQIASAALTEGANTTEIQGSTPDYSTDPTLVSIDDASALELARRQIKGHPLTPPYSYRKPL